LPAVVQTIFSPVAGKLSDRIEPVCCNRVWQSHLGSHFYISLLTPLSVIIISLMVLVLVCTLLITNTSDHEFGGYTPSWYCIQYEPTMRSSAVLSMQSRWYASLFYRNVPITLQSIRTSYQHNRYVLIFTALLIGVGVSYVRDHSYIITVH